MIRSRFAAALALALTASVWTPASAQPAPVAPAAPAAVRAMTPREAYEAQQAGQVLLIDVRTPSEWAQTGAPKGAARLDMQDPAFAQKLEALRKTSPDKQLALICRSGNRSAQAASGLAKLGWSGIVDVTGGVAGGRGERGWIAEGLPMER
jgi:rhodanese-related sulfurtransferase